MLSLLPLIALQATMKPPLTSGLMALSVRVLSPTLSRTVGLAPTRVPLGSTIWTRSPAAESNQVSATLPFDNAVTVGEPWIVAALPSGVGETTGFPALSKISKRIGWSVDVSDRQAAKKPPPGSEASPRLKRGSVLSIWIGLPIGSPSGPWTSTYTLN